MIAFASKEEIEEAIAKTDFISYTQHTITSPDEYLKMCIRDSH